MTRQKGQTDHVNDSGYLDVGDGHRVYWEDWGNKDAKPIFYLHGGPGGGFHDGNKLLFDPLKHHVIFHDQRGSGRAKPFGEMKNNTSQDLVEDINKLRDHLGIKEKAYIMGGSWGSTLSLLYAIAHPGKVEKLLIWSVYLVRQFETDYVNEGWQRHSFPEAWDRFIALVPEEHRKDGEATMAYYAKMINSENQEVAKKYSDEWTLWEYSLCTINYDQQAMEAEILDDPDNIAIAKLETHYFMNKCFVPENYILDGIDKVKDIPCFIIHGRFDLCTPPVAARDLAIEYGKNASLQWVRSGHLRTDPEMFTAIQTATLAEFI